MISYPKPFRFKEFIRYLNPSGFHSDSEILSQKTTIYLKDYLGKKGLGATHFLFEEEYVNRDFLLDYSEYYSKCFTNEYGRKCKRMHFFSFDFERQKIRERFTAALHNPEEHKYFWDTYYLGFIVIKPIPSSIIGFSLLKTYNKKTYTPDRKFWAIKPCKVHLFGVEIHFDALPFLNQDRVLGACASVAVWTVFQYSSSTPFSIQKSPGEITKDAAMINHDGGRIIPNDGLIVPDMCKALTKNGLDTIVQENKGLPILNAIKSDTSEDPEHPQVLKIKSRKPSQEFIIDIKRLIYAYSDLKLPIIIGVDIKDEEGKKVEHAVTVVGHNENPNRKGIKFNSDRIDKLYVHDDQLGPFSRIRIRNNGQLITSHDIIRFQNERGLTHNIDRTIPLDYDCTDPIVIIIPVFPKVRITFEDIFKITAGIDGILDAIKDVGLNKINWDVKVKLSNKYLEELRSSGLYNPLVTRDRNKLQDILQQSAPKYLWVSTCFNGEDRLFDVLFDATDFSKGLLIHKFICHHDRLKKILYKHLDMNFDYYLRKLNKGPEIFPYYILNFIRKELK